MGVQVFSKDPLPPHNVIYPFAVDLWGGILRDSSLKQTRYGAEMEGSFKNWYRFSMLIMN